MVDVGVEALEIVGYHSEGRVRWSDAMGIEVVRDRGRQLRVVDDPRVAPPWLQGFDGVVDFETFEILLRDGKTKLKIVRHDWN